MKIVKEVRDLYTSGFPIYNRLSKDVKSLLEPVAIQNGWFFSGRVKELESFALKLETGRIADPSRLEDFFACTIVVPTIAQVRAAEAAVLAEYELVERRPANDEHTRKRPYSFEFDDLRLYVSQRPTRSGRDTEIALLVFEVQIKTALQFAWGQATHDLTYKSDSVSWPLERVAYQIKAMLEHAEIAIAEAKQLSLATAVAKQHRDTIELESVISTLRDIWSPESLPTDLKRLAENILRVLRACDLRANDLSAVLEVEIARLSLLPLDLSPYAFTVQALAWTEAPRLKRALKDHRSPRIVVHRGMELPDWFRTSHPKVLNMRTAGASA